MNDDQSEQSEEQGQTVTTAQPESVIVLAERAGFLPQYRAKSGRLNVNYWKFAAARAVKGWNDSSLLTQEQFDAAIAQVASHTYR